MIQPAERTKTVQEYFFSQKIKEIEILNQSGPKVINLGIGNPDMFPSQETLDELTMHINSDAVNIHGYQSYVGTPELRKAFSGFYKTWYGVDLDPNTEILPLIGSKEGVMYVSMTYLNPGDKILVPNPGYPTYQSINKILGNELVIYDLKPENNWLPDFDELEQMDLSGVKVMWVNYPNMPTGQPATMELYEKLVAFGKKHNILIVNDNPYSFILNDNPISLMAVPGAKDIAIELNSLSKSHNMAGFRIGMIAAAPEVIKEILKVKSNVDTGMYKPLQLAAAKALQSGKEWFKAINAEYAKRRELVWQLFDLIGCEYSKDQCGMFIWARIPEKYTDAFELSDYYLHKAKVFITPGTIFGSMGVKYARISLCSNVDTIKESINRIKEIQK